MNTEDTEIPVRQNLPPGTAGTPPPAKHRHIPNLLGWGFVILTVLVLAGVLLPVGSRVGVMGPQTKALASAKQIGLALKLFAGDHDGNFPRQGVPPEMQRAPANANEAFACLFPTYCTAEKLFVDGGLSAYQTRTPDEVYDAEFTGKQGKTLEPGENVYGYVMGLTDNDDPALPLVVDGTDGLGHYVTDPKKRGGVWKGRRAIVIHVDDSGEVATLAGPDNARFIPRSHDDPTHNLLDPAYLNAHHARLLDPAVAVGH